MLEKDRERLKNEVRISQVVNLCVFISRSIAIGQSAIDKVNRTV